MRSCQANNHTRLSQLCVRLLRLSASRLCGADFCSRLLGLRLSRLLGLLRSGPISSKSNPVKKEVSFLQISPFHGSGRVVFRRYSIPAAAITPRRQRPPEARCGVYLVLWYRYTPKQKTPHKRRQDAKQNPGIMPGVFPGAAARRVAGDPIGGGRFTGIKKNRQAGSPAACGLWPKMIFFQNVVICFAAGVKIN
jgi:hypothetical protein